MALTPDKYHPLHVDLEKSEYRALQRFVAERGWTLAHFVRIAIQRGMLDMAAAEGQGYDWTTGRQLGRARSHNP